MGLFEGITHKEEIESILSQAQSIQNNSVERFNHAKSNAESKLQKYGETKLDVYNNSLTNFLSYFSVFKNVNMTKLSLSENQPINADISSSLIALKDDINYSKKLMITAGTSLAISVAAYGGLKLLGGAGVKATGFVAAKVISTKAAMVAPLIFVPVFVALGIGAAIKGKARLAEANKILEQTKLEASKTDSYTIIYNAISRGARNYDSFVKSYNVKYRNIVSRVGEMSIVYPKDEDGKIDFDSLNEVDQRTLHLSWLMTQIIYGILKQPLIDENGRLCSGSENALLETKKKSIDLARQYPYEVTNILRNPNKTAKLWLIPCYITFGLSIILSMFFISKDMRTAGALLMVNAMLCFPFSIFIRRMPPKIKTIIRIVRFAVCTLAFILICVFSGKM